MKKILVPTDFSGNSKAGIRFAIRMAAKMRAQLIFFHSVSEFMSSMITAEAAVVPHLSDLKRETEKLKKFILGIYRSMGVRPPANIKFVVESAMFAGESILSAAKRLKAGLIVLSTHGAGGLEKIIGTSTGTLITKSSVPVLAVPKDYRYAGIAEIMYASDLDNLKTELLQLVPLAKMLNVPVRVVHFDYFRGQMRDIDKTFKSATARIRYKKVSLQSVPAAVNFSLIRQIEKYTRGKKKTILAMFARQDRSLFEKIFLGSKTRSLSFRIKIPLLSMKK